MTGLRKKLNKNLKKVKPAAKKIQRMSRKVTRNINEYIEADQKGALKFKPDLEEIKL